MTRKKIVLCTRKPKMYEVVKNNKIDRKISKENDIKYKNIRQNYSYTNLYNIQYFLWTPLVLFIDFTSFGRSIKSKLFKFSNFFFKSLILTLCVNAHGLR